MKQKYAVLFILLGFTNGWATVEFVPEEWGLKGAWGETDTPVKLYQHPYEFVQEAPQTPEFPSVLLSCLGGGTRGLLSATLLHELEKKIGNGFDASSCNHFAGTSTGGLIAAAKALNIRTKKIQDIYRDHGSEIFYHSEIPFFAQLKQFFREKYTVDNFVSLDQKIFSKKKRLGDVEKHLTLVSYDISGGPTNKPGPFVMDSKGSHESRKMLLWECLRSTTAAPSYFPPHQTSNNRSLIDGGLCSNDPTLVAISRIRKLDRQNGTHDFDNLSVVTLGTGFYSAPIDQKSAKSAGLAEIIPEILDWTTTGVQQMTAYNCKQLMGDNYICLNPNLGKATPALDDASPENLAYLEDVALSYFQGNPKKMDRASKLLQGIQPN